LNASALKVTSEGRAIEFKGREYDGAFNIYKGDGGLITVVNVLPIEEYLLGLVASEMPTDWPIEAVKAQAVIARSYAMYQRNMKAQGVSSGRHDVEAGVQDQVYQGKRGVNKRVEDAVSSTKGEILKKNGRLVKAFFHSTCGGATEKASNVWGEKNDFLAVKDEFCSRSPYSSWTYRITKRELAEKLAANGFPGSFVGSISIENRKENPRAATVIVESGGQTFYIQANEFRRIVGYAKLKSAWFSVSSEGEDIIFSGKGFGHGVGLCQWGAKGMAEARKDYREILKYYYPGTEISGQ
jgi:stage II sporulation protein D